MAAPGPVKYKVSQGLFLAYGLTCGMLGVQWQKYVTPWFFPPKSDSFFKEGPCTRRGKQIQKYGAPKKAPDVTYYRNHTLYYDQAKKIPSWVAEHLTDWMIRGNASRQLALFTEDEEFEELYRSKESDYDNSGYSMGQLAPPGNNKYDQLAMDASFIMSNVVPQNPENHSDFWNRFELYCRDLTNKYKDVRVISGPLFLPTGEEKVKVKGQDGSSTTVSQKFVKYPVIGDSEVAVPTHLFKLVVADAGDDVAIPSQVAAFIVPNQPIPKETQLTKYQVPLETLEAKSGFNLVPGLNRRDMGDLCESDGCQLMSFEKFHKFFTIRRMESALTLDTLEKVWKEVDQKKLTRDSEMWKAYETRKSEIAGKGAV